MKPATNNNATNSDMGHHVGLMCVQLDEWTNYLNPNFSSFLPVVAVIIHYPSSLQI